MSNARELALLEKWTDVAATTIPPISPTSPKATKFCCCPNRRRYNLKHPKGSTLNARNIFTDNDFTYIDDIAQETYGNGPSETLGEKVRDIVAEENRRLSHEDCSTGDFSDYDDISDGVNDERGNYAGVGKLMYDDFIIQQQKQPQQQPPQQQQLQRQSSQQNDKHCSHKQQQQQQQQQQTQQHNTHTNYYEQEDDNIKNKNCSCFEMSTAMTTAQSRNQNLTLITGKLNETTNPNTIRSNSNNENNINAATVNRHDNVPNSDSNKRNTNECRKSNHSDHQIQRLSNSELNFNNKGSNSSNIDSKSIGNNVRHKKFEIDLQNKMTITTTNVASRKQTECGLRTSQSQSQSSSPSPSPSQSPLPLPLPTPTMTTPTTAKATATATAPLSPTSVRPTTPTLTTVIKTTMVKRSPVNESTTAKTPTTPTTPTTPKSAANAANHVGTLGQTLRPTSAGDTTNSAETPRTVKERIAAIIAGNEQANNHDNAFKCKSQCNKNQNNMTTQQQQQQQKCAINNTSQHGGVAGSRLSSQQCPAAIAATVAVAAKTTATPTEVTAATPAIESPRAKSLLNDTSFAVTVGSSGSATMPRRRSALQAATERAGNTGSGGSGSGSGSNLGGTKADKRMSNGDMGVAAATPDSDNKLAALDNLDLALSLELTDEDGDDPYFALQEYLEKVKHEINEVFELHKARQRMQNEQEQEQEEGQGQQDEEPESSPLPRTDEEMERGAQGGAVTAAANDELSLSRESDSGFDSATGGRHNTSAGYKLPAAISAMTSSSSSSSSKSATAHASPVRDVVVGRQQNGTNGQAPFAAAATAAVESQTTSNKQARAQLQQQQQQRTMRTEEQTKPTTTKLKALPPPPLSPVSSDAVAAAEPTASASKVKRPQHQQDDRALVAELPDNDDVNIWANKFLRDLDNLMASDKPTSSSASSSPTSTTSPMLLSAAATAAIQSRYGKSAVDREQYAAANGFVLRPEKHTTIPLQSFNLDGGGRLDAKKSNIAYIRTLSAPNACEEHDQTLSLSLTLPQTHSPTNDNKSGCMAAGKGNRNSLAAFSAAAIAMEQSPYNGGVQHGHGHGQTMNAAAPTAMTILKIEETATSGRRQAAAAAAMAAELTQNAAEDALKSRRQRQLENDMETIHVALSASQSPHQIGDVEAANSTSDNKNTLMASAMATPIPKRERINHATTSTIGTLVAGNAASPPYAILTPSKTHVAGTSSLPLPLPLTTTTTATATPTSSYLLNGSDATKKGSTSTIWTSEESILRSVGAVDEDNNSTSSSACEEASGVLSSGKSGISLDSSGLDNDNNESGIGTATPPKDISYWKGTHNDNESVSSLDVLRKMKFQKSNSVASSDDPDLLEVLSLCDEPRGDEDVCEDAIDSQVDSEERHQHQQQQQQQQQQKQQKRQKHHQRDTAEALESHADDDGDEADRDDEGHDVFVTAPYCDCDCTDGDVSSTSGSGTSASRGHPTANADKNGVVLRRKCHATPIMVPYGGRTQKCHSHSLDTSSLPTSYQQHHYHYHPHSQLARKLHHLQHRTKERGQLSLALRQEPFQSLLAPTHFHDLPSPSSASLHSGHESLGIQELTTKSNSAPLLLRQEQQKRDDFAGQKLTLRYSRSQSDRYLAEIEAVEACKWLRAAGFPQYAQMYEDHQFPIDLTNVAKDHTNLENDQLQSLYRRLCILNRCANMRLDQSHKTQTPQKDDSDDENFALSENWTFQPHIRRWSRIGEMGLELPPGGKINMEKTESSSKESSPDRFEDDTYDVTGAGLSLTLPGTCTDNSMDASQADSADSSGVRLRRTGSERLKDGAKAFLRRVESIKSRRRKRQNREGVVISGPQTLDLAQLGQRSSLRKPDAVYSTPPSPSAVSPMHTFPKSPFFGNELKVPSQSETFLSPNRASPKRTPTTPRSMRTSPLHFFSNQMPHLKEGKSDDSSSYYSDSQESSAGGKLLSLRKTPSKTRRFLQRTGKVDDIGAHSDSECHQGRKLLIKDANSNTTEVKIKKLTRGGSLNLGKEPKKRDGMRTSSFRSRSVSRKETKADDADHVKKTPVVRWHSFQMEERPHMIFRKCFSQKIDPHSNDHGIPFAAMSAGQLQIIRKLALVILTGHMERYCPTHRSGWNWELPKFIKKIKMPDYKDKKVFGVPLLLVLQRSGQTLPIAVRAAFRWLQLNALDQIGIFRKSGVKSRIIKLKELIEDTESSAECMDVYDAQQAYDVADMLKQYFRDLPESLLTTKMSETFVAIFQHLPSEVRLDAVQCAVLLLPDENREILYALLEFLTLVAANSQYNQMTANNLAVCLAPSLFHSSISTGASSVSASPRRRKGAGVPDVKELSEAKASHECLAFMIENYKLIYTASKDKISKCNFGYMEESKPVPLEALGEGMQFHNWRGYLYECTSATIKEGREKTRGWITIASQNDSSVEIAYKKVGDGHPLRLWRCITEIEGPPKDVLDYIIKQRASWDANLLQSQTVKKLDERTDIFQYVLDGQIGTDFCVLRSWQTDLPRGACVIVETSIEHAKAKPVYGAVRGVVLASRYLIEPCGGGRSRVMHLARVDIKGKTPEWYNKSYGHICAHYLSKIRTDFKNVTEGPESKV